MNQSPQGQMTFAIRQSAKPRLKTWITIATAAEEGSQAMMHRMALATGRWKQPT
jgi:hypothetical protein